MIGLGAALDYVEAVGRAAIGAWEERAAGLRHRAVGELDGVRIIGTAREKASVLSFVVEGVHPHDVGTVLDDEGVAIRAGHHCAQPVMRPLRRPGHRAGVVRLLQHACGGRCPGARAPPGPEVFA